jgi:hypothetical protein
MHALHQADGILRVDVQEPRMRAKRSKPDEPFALPPLLKSPIKRCEGTAGMARLFGHLGVADTVLL